MTETLEQIDFGLLIDQSNRFNQLNPVVDLKNLTLEQDTGRWKLGDGGTDYQSLPYLDQLLGLSGNAQPTVTPGAPLGVSLTPTAYPAGGASNASTCDVFVSIAPPSTNTDGTTITDIHGYEISTLEINPAPNPLVTPALTDQRWSAWTALDGPTTTLTKRTSGAELVVKARVVNQELVRSSPTASSPVGLPYYSAALNPPSTPTVKSELSTLSAVWDGNFSDGTPASANSAFDHIEVHWSTSSSFTPSAATLGGVLYAPGSSFNLTANYGTTYYCLFVAVTKVGSRSGPSAIASGAPQQVVSADLFVGCVGSAQLAYLAVLTANINDLAVNNAKIGDLRVGKLTSDYMSAQVTVSGQIATAPSGQRVIIDSAGIHFVDNNGNTIVDLSTVTGGAQFQGAINSGSTITGTTITGSRIIADGGYGSVQLGSVGNYNRVLWQSSNSSYSTALIGIDEGGTTGLFQIRGAGSTHGRIEMQPNQYTLDLWGLTTMHSGATCVGGFNVSGGTIYADGNIATSATALANSFQSQYDDTQNTGVLLANNSGGIYIASNRTSNPVRLIFGLASATQGYIDANGAMKINGALTQNANVSTIKHKWDVQDETVAPDLIDRIRYVSYNLTTTRHNFELGRMHGVIAEEMVEHPDLEPFVTRGDDGELESVLYDKLDLALVMSVNAKLNAALARIDALENA